MPLAIQVAILLLSIKQSGDGGVYLEMNSVLGRFVTNRNSYLSFVGDLRRLRRWSSFESLPSKGFANRLLYH